MPEIVQVSLPGYNASLKQCDIDDIENATIQQLLGQLLDEHGRHIASEIECDIDQASGLSLDDIAANRQLWGIQRIVMSSPNRRWSDDELLALPETTNVLDGQTRVSTVVPCATSLGRTKDRPDLPARQFSDFALTQHLSIPLIRIIYIPFALDVIFSHIPEFPENFQLVYYVAGNTTVEEVIECLLDELGIRKLVTEGAKKERVEYSLVLGDTVLPMATRLMPHLTTNSAAGPPYTVNFSISQLWFARIGTVARSFSKALQRPSIGSKASQTRVSPTSTANPGTASASTWRPASIWGSLWSSTGDEGTLRGIKPPSVSSAGAEDGKDDDSEGEGTLKGLQATARKRTSSIQTKNAVSNTARLSTLFTGWGSPQSSPQDSESPRPRTRMVSEPVLLDDNHRMSMLSLEMPVTVLGDPTPSDSPKSATHDTSNEAEDLDFQLEVVMNALGLKEAAKANMRTFDVAKKRVLIAQHNQRPVASHRSGPDPTNTIKHTVPSTSSTSAVTKPGQAHNRKSSLIRWASLAPQEGNPASPTLDEGLPTQSRTSSPNPTPAPLLQTATGWTSWFTAGSPAKRTDANDKATANSSVAKDTPIWYITQIKGKKNVTRDLVKHLIALRVRLSTESLSWIEEFLQKDGIGCLQELLKDLTNTGSIKREADADIEESVQIECVRCLRVVANTPTGFDCIKSSNIITYLVYTLHTPSHKLRAQLAEMLAGLCFLGKDRGQPLQSILLSAFSDAKIAYEEEFRFEHLLQSIAFKEPSDDDVLRDEDEPGLWEYRRTAIALINTLTGLPDGVEDRVALRDELARRGFNEIITTLKYISPPEDLLGQIALYLEERQEDQEIYLDHIRRTRIKSPMSEKPPMVYPEMQALLAANPNMYTSILKLVEYYSACMQRPLDGALSSDLDRIILKFMELSESIVDLEGSWDTFFSSFLTSIEDLVGRQAVLRGTRTANTANVPSSFLDELTSLRARVEQLEDERTALQASLNDRTAVNSTMKSLKFSASPTSESAGDAAAPSGLIGRLVEKEKQVTALKAELAALKAAKPGEKTHDDGKKDRAERNRQWANLMDEITQNKAQIAELEASLDARDKENKYLKRTLESVYTRFQVSNPASQPSEAVDQPLPKVKTEVLAAGTIEAIAQRDEQIQALKDELAQARKNAAHAIPILNSAFPANFRAARPAPKPPSPGATIVATPQATSNATAVSKTVSAAPALSKAGAGSQGPVPPPPPPPPPPPSFMPSSQRQPVVNNRAIPVAPPPPPPPGSSKIPLAPPAPPAPPFAKANAAHSTAGVPPPPPPPPLTPRAKRLASDDQATPRIQVHRSASSVVSPKSKLKPFFWNKLAQPAVVQTVWSTLETVQVSIDVSELETAFTAEVKGKAAAANTVKKPKGVSLLPHAKAQNAGIMLARIRMTHSAIRDAILQIDDRKMTVERLRALKTCVPTVDEMRGLTAFSGPDSDLVASDIYFKTVMVIPRLEQRLNCMITRKRFDLDLEELRPELAILRNAADEIRHSTKFRRVLKLVLDIGNALNASTFRGNARGFQLDALLKLRDTRASAANVPASTSTLLHFTVKQIRKHDDSLIYFLSESPHVQAASRISSSVLSTSVSTAKKAIAEVDAELTLIRGLPEAFPNDRFIPVMQAFLAEAQPAISALTDVSSLLEQDLASLLTFFGEDPSNTKPEDFFTTIASFASALHDADDEVLEAERKANKGLKTAGPEKGRQRSFGRGGFDNALRDIRSGTGLRRHRQEASSSRPLSRIFLDGSHR